MKIDKRDPGHWLLLLLFFFRACAGLVARWRLAREKRWGVVLYGHRLNGNLLALYRHLDAIPGSRSRPAFLSLDAVYCRQLRESGFNVLWAAGVECTDALAGAAALVSDHGLHSIQPLQRLYQRTGMRFFDVWHGIPFKGFDGNDFRVQHGYDEVWVASPLLRDLYVHRFGFRPDTVHVTGYARTDRLICAGLQPVEQLRARYGVPMEGPVILFAPTWAQDDRGRSIYPFEHEPAQFLGALSSLARTHRATIVLRTHLNTGTGATTAHPGVMLLPSSSWPDTEEILLMSDVLICDWSSIAFDFLLLDRPTFFLDVAPPFRKGYSLGPEYRFGAIIGNLDELHAGISECLVDPARYWRAHRGAHERIRSEIYGNFADGNASARCAQRLSAADLLDDRGR